LLGVRPTPGLRVSTHVKPTQANHRREINQANHRREISQANHRREINQANHRREISQGQREISQERDRCVSVGLSRTRANHAVVAETAASGAENVEPYPTFKPGVRNTPGVRVSMHAKATQGKREINQVNHPREISQDQREIKQTKSQREIKQTKSQREINQAKSQRETKFR